MKKLAIDLTNVVITLIIAALATLCTSYFSNFASRADVDLKIQDTKAEIKAVEAKQDAKFDKVLSGLCIIDNRTCTLKDK